jgi:outer membrane immunogenic protein
LAEAADAASIAIAVSIFLECCQNGTVLAGVVCYCAGDGQLETGGPMNKLLLATAAVAFATVGSAGAADLPMKAPPMVAAAPAMTWTGCYVDGGIGYGMWNQDEAISFGGLNTGTYTNGGRGWLGRVGVGCDYQFTPSFVIGVFGDYDFMNLKGTVQGANFTATGLGGVPVAADEKEKSAWYIGGRLGYLPYPNLMTFVSGGWTETRFNQRDYFSLLTGTLTGISLPQHDYSGWFLGGGTEYAVPWASFRGLFWKTEYRFSEYRADNLGAFVTATGLPNGTVANDQKFVQTVTTSLVWKFNWGGPVVARY